VDQYLLSMQPNAGLTYWRAKALAEVQGSHIGAPGLWQRWPH